MLALIYEIKLSKTNKRDILNAQIYNYKIKNNLFTRPVLEYKIECENS
jgi:hypothetical protein